MASQNFQKKYACNYASGVLGREIPTLRQNFYANYEPAKFCKIFMDGQNVCKIFMEIMKIQNFFAGEGKILQNFFEIMKTKISHNFFGCKIFK